MSSGCLRGVGLSASYFILFCIIWIFTMSLYYFCNQKTQERYFDFEQNQIKWTSKDQKMLLHQNHWCPSKQNPLSQHTLLMKRKTLEQWALWPSPNDRLHVYLETWLTECWVSAAESHSARGPLCVSVRLPGKHVTWTPQQGLRLMDGQGQTSTPGMHGGPEDHRFMWEPEHFIRNQQEWIDLSLSPQKFFFLKLDFNEIGNFGNNY